jgi:hypothetical protein
LLCGAQARVPRADREASAPHGRRTAHADPADGFAGGGPNPQSG